MNFVLYLFVIPEDDAQPLVPGNDDGFTVIDAATTKGRGVGENLVRTFVAANSRQNVEAPRGKEEVHVTGRRPWWMIANCSASFGVGSTNAAGK